MLRMYSFVLSIPQELYIGIPNHGIVSVSKQVVNMHGLQSPPYFVLCPDSWHPSPSTGCLRTLRMAESTRLSDHGTYNASPHHCHFIYLLTNNVLFGDNFRIWIVLLFLSPLIASVMFNSFHFVGVSPLCPYFHDICALSSRLEIGQFLTIINSSDIGTGSDGINPHTTHF